MIDTMTGVKLVLGFCGTFLVFLLGGWVAEIIYHGGGGHKDDHHHAFVIEPEETGVEDEPVEEIDVAAVLASGSAEDGEGLWRNCRSCHAIAAGENGVGPYLHGVVGREIGAASGFAQYSGALSEAGDVWTPEALFAFLENPSGWAPGTSMGYNGMRDPQDRADLIAYLDSLDD